MPNIGYFEIPADDTARAAAFYRSLLGWEIAPDTNLDPASQAAIQYHRISTGPAQEGTLNSGGLYRRQAGEGPKNFVFVPDIDAVLARVERLGGTILMQRTEIGGVGPVAVVRDTEGNPLGLWTPMKSR